MVFGMLAPIMMIAEGGSSDPLMASILKLFFLHLFPLVQ